jgi:hypothetical protein
MIGIESIRRLIQRRRGAYRIVFAQDQLASKIVLDDLKQFCRATSAPIAVSRQSGMVDPIATGISIGRQEVWHRIAQHIHVSDEDLYRFVDNSGENDE